MRPSRFCTKTTFHCILTYNRNKPYPTYVYLDMKTKKDIFNELLEELAWSYLGDLPQETINAKVQEFRRRYTIAKNKKEKK